MSKPATVARPTPLEEAYAARLWLVIQKYGPGPGLLDLLREELIEANESIDPKSDTFKLALRESAWKAECKPLVPEYAIVDNAWSEAGSNARDYMISGAWSIGREWSGTRGNMDPLWFPFHDAALKCIDILEYVEGLP